MFDDHQGRSDPLRIAKPAGRGGCEGTADAEEAIAAVTWEDYVWVSHTESICAVHRTSGQTKASSRRASWSCDGWMKCTKWAGGTWEGGVQSL